MKRIVSIILAIIIVMLPTRAYATAYDEYKKWLDDNDGYSTVFEDTASQWEAFLDHLYPPGDDVQIIPKLSSSKGVYRVDTLAGGNGAGFKNGNKNTAKINVMSNIVTTKNGDIYFIDDKYKTIRKISNKTKLISNVYTLSGNQNVTFEEDHRTYSYKNGYINKIVYNSYNNTIYFGTAYNAGQDNALTTIRKLDSKKTLIAYDRHTKYKAPFISYADFIVFEKDKMWVSERFGLYGNPSNILTANANAKAQEAAVFAKADYDHPEVSEIKKLRGRNEVIITNKYIYIYDTVYKELRRIDKKTKKEITITKHNIDITCVIAVKNKFYLTYNSTIYEMDLNGKTKAILDNDNYSTYIGGITAINLDAKGNLLISDALSYDKRGNVTNASLKRINIKK